MSGRLQAGLLVGAVATGAFVSGVAGGGDAKQSGMRPSPWGRPELLGSNPPQDLSWTLKGGDASLTARAQPLAMLVTPDDMPCPKASKTALIVRLPIERPLAIDRPPTITLRYHLERGSRVKGRPGWVHGIVDGNINGGRRTTEALGGWTREAEMILPVDLDVLHRDHILDIGVQLRTCARLNGRGVLKLDAVEVRS